MSAKDKIIILSWFDHEGEKISIIMHKNCVNTKNTTSWVAYQLLVTLLKENTVVGSDK